MTSRAGRPVKLRLPAAPLAVDPVTKSAFARLLGCGKARVSEWTGKGVLVPPAITVGGLVLPRAAAEQLLAAGAVLPGLQPGPAPGAAALAAMTYDEARTAAETLRVHHALADLQERHNNLVPRELSDAVLFTAGRALRDAWLGWPARVAAVMAAKLGVEPAALLTELDLAVREQLQAVGDPAADWRLEMKRRRSA